MDVLGATLLGWAILNIPKIIGIVEEVSKNIQKVIGVLQEWFNNISEWFTGLTSDLDDKLNQLRNIFIDDEEFKIRQAEGQIKQSLERMTQETGRQKQRFLILYQHQQIQRLNLPPKNQKLIQLSFQEKLQEEIQVNYYL